MWWHTVTHGRGEVKWKLANGVGSQYSSHYLVTWCIQHYYRWCAPRLPVVDWTDAPADLNGLVRFAKRRNLVSGLCHHILTGLYTNVIPEKWLRDATNTLTLNSLDATDAQPLSASYRGTQIVNPWSIQLSFLLFTACRIFLSSLTLLDFSHDRFNLSTFFSSTTFQNFPDISDQLSEASNFLHCTKLYSNVAIY